MQNYDDSNKEFCTHFVRRPSSNGLVAVQKSKSIKELLNSGATRIRDLKSRVEARSQVLAVVRANLDPAQAEAVISAGVTEGVLSVGVSAASWAARLRYQTDMLRSSVEQSIGVEIRTVRIRVIPPA